MGDGAYGNKNFPAYVKGQLNFIPIARADEKHEVRIKMSFGSTMSYEVYEVSVDPTASLYKIKTGDDIYFVHTSLAWVEISPRTHTINEKITPSSEDV